MRSGSRSVDRGAERTLEGRAVGGCAVRRQHELHRLVEQRPQPARNVLDRHALRQPARANLEALAEVDQGVPRDDRTNALVPEDEVELALTTWIRLHPE